MKNYYEKKRLEIRHKDRYRVHTEQFDAAQIAEFLNVTLQTAYKYINEQHHIDPAKKELLIIKGLGKIPFPNWDGFYFEPSGNLIGRNGYSLNAEEIGNFTYIKQLKTLLEVENKKLKERIEELENAANYNNILLFKSPA